MPELAFVMSPRQNYFFHEIVSAVRHELDAQGIRSSLHERFPEARSDRVFVLVPPHEYVALEGKDKLPSDQLLARTIFICAEQPGTVHFTDNLELAPRAGAVFDINPRSVELFRERAGVEAKFLALGYTGFWDHYDPDRERDIDVLFLGSASPRRLRYLSLYGPLLSRWKTHLRISDNSAPNTGSSTSFVTDEKWDLLSRAKILVNVHQGEEPYFEWLRAMDAIHCGAVIVSERSEGFEPLRSGHNVFFGDPRSLGYMVDGLLADPAYLAQIGQETYDFVKWSMPFAASVAELAGAARTLVARPIPADPAPPIVVTDRAPIGPPPTPAPSVVHDTESTLSLLRAGLKDSRLDLMALRRQLARMEAAIRSARSEPPALVERVHETPAWGARSASKVSTITALYNYRDLISLALDSVAASSFGDVESVIVDDGSSDGSADAVIEWMDAHPEIPVLLLRHPINRGLGAARNTAVDFARGEFAFVLDSDNVLYPRCLGALVDALEEDSEAVFAYPILEAFGLVDSYVEMGGSPLVSYHGWNPAIFRHANYIDALSMIRLADLRRLGGYATDRRLFGWEDYDLWCAIAEEGRYGRQVPEILARYRVSPSSMRSLTNLSEADAMTALIERHPTLMDGVIPRP
jgi:GT2 family glycosyltransferase